MNGYLTSEDVARMFPAEGGRTTHVNTINAWITRGVKGIRLQAWKPGKRYYTTAEAVQQFLEAIRTAKDSKIDAAASHARKSRARQAAVKKAAKRHGMKNAK